MKKLNKKLKIVIAVILAAVTILSGSAIAFAATIDFTPTIPILYGEWDKILFSQEKLSTPSRQMDGWKYYYWCNYSCQYTADYTVHINANQPISVWIYDGDGTTMLAEDSGVSSIVSGVINYDCELTYQLTEGHEYYFKVSFTGGNRSSCGTFTASFTSGGGNRVMDDDHVHLYIGGSSVHTYNADNFSIEQLRRDLSFSVVFKDGTYATWTGENYDGTSVPKLNGCDLLFDLTNCEAALGTYTISARYMGYIAYATYRIIECSHSDIVVTTAEPTWLSRGYTSYRCRICSSIFTGDYIESGSELFALAGDAVNSVEGDDNYSKSLDFNNDGVINNRDYRSLLIMYEQANNEFRESVNSRAGDDNYNSEFDFNNDGVINIRDYLVMLLSRP